MNSLTVTWNFCVCRNVHKTLRKQRLLKIRRLEADREAQQLRREIETFEVGQACPPFN